MSKDWVQDIADMHAKFGVNDWMKQKLDNKGVLRNYLSFRISMLLEELQETDKALSVQDDEGIVDGIIDLCVFAIGTLDVMGVNAYDAWNVVHNANMEKTPGVKPNRPNPFGLPDLIKPDGWTGPEHAGNHGHLENILK